MKRIKLQLSGYFFGICALFALGSFFTPELKADTREPINPLVAENLPAETNELVCFNSAALDQAGSKLLDMVATGSGSLRDISEVFPQMVATEKNKGHFYMASVPKFGWFILVKNGMDSDEIIIAPEFLKRNMTARKMPGGYFALFPVGKELPAMGLSDELKQKIAMTPNEVLRCCWAGGMPTLLNIVNRDGVYTLSTIQPEAGKAGMTMETFVDKVVAFVPENNREAAKAFLKENLKFSSKTLDGKNVYELEFPLNEKTLTFWNDYIRTTQEERGKKDAPKVIALSPPNGATGVDPNLKEIKVTFDRPMSKTSWSFCQRSYHDFPESLSQPSYDESGTVITLPVQVVPERTYNIYLNSPPYIGFRSAKGGVLQSVHYTFTTGK